MHHLWWLNETDAELIDLNEEPELDDEDFAWEVPIEALFPDDLLAPERDEDADPWSAADEEDDPAMLRLDLEVRDDALEATAVDLHTLLQELNEHPSPDTVQLRQRLQSQVELLLGVLDLEPADLDLPRLPRR